MHEIAASIDLFAKIAACLSSIQQDDERGRGLGHLSRSYNLGRHGGSIVVRQTVVLQSRVHIRHLPSPQLIANLLVGCHLGWHLAAG